MGVAEVVAALAAASDGAAAEQAARYFKTGPGEYGEGDVFLGVTMPAQRRIARQFADLGDLDPLLSSEVHEHRMTALLIMVEQYRTRPAERAALVERYLASARAGWIDNWDLVDATAEFILGDFHLDRSRNVFFKLAKSDNLWERRIAIVATHAFIRAGDATTTLELADKLVREKHDLIQKAVGWMLREVGKRVDQSLLLEFLDRNAGRMPRTMLSYAVEHLPPAERIRYRAVPRE